MGKGQPVEQWQREEFAAEYLITGNISAASRAAQLPVRTGWEVAMELDGDPDFAARRRALRVGALSRSAARLEAMAEVAADRFHSETGGIETKQMGGKDGAIVVTDKRQDYGRLLVEIDRNVQSAARLERELEGEAKAPTQVVITVAPSPAAAARIAEQQAPQDGAPESAPEGKQGS